MFLANDKQIELDVTVQLIQQWAGCRHEAGHHQAQEETKSVIGYCIITMRVTGAAWPEVCELVVKMLLQTMVSFTNHVVCLGAGVVD